MQLLSVVFGALVASGSAMAATTGTPTAKGQNSGIFDSAGKVLTAVVAPNLPHIPTGTVDLALPAPVPVRITLTNAERMRRGMGPMAPYRKRSSRVANAPRASCAPVATQGYIEVYDASSNVQLGYISHTYDFQNSYTYTALESGAQVFKIPATNQYNTLINIEAVNGPDSDFPLIGGVGGSGGFELGQGRSDYVYLSGVGSTNAGSTPSDDAGNSIESLGYEAPSESAIFALSCNLELGVQWVDDIGFTTPKSENFFYDPSVDYIGVTADLAAFNDAFPGEGGIPLTLKFSPL